MIVKMLIGLYEEKIKQDGKYDVAELWHNIDTIMFREGFYKEDPEEYKYETELGGTLYGTRDDEKAMGRAWITMDEFDDVEWFKEYCNDWLYLKKNRHTNEFGADDVLEEYYGRRSISI